MAVAGASAPAFALFIQTGKKSRVAEVFSEPKVWEIFFFFYSINV
jgi:hypothetical protein